MADEHNTYPVLPSKQWWTLRNRFKQTMPNSVAPSYLVRVLAVSEKSAKSTVIPNLKRLGLIDQEGRVSDRARKWRDDEEYSKVCAEIREEVYPEELRNVAPDPVNDKGAAMRWFASKTGSGISAVSQMTSLYRLLTDADVSMASDVSRGSTGTNKPGKQGTTPKNTDSPSNGRSRKSSQVGDATPQAGDTPSAVPTANEPKVSQPSVPERPTLYIDIQIHISSDASSDQIDQIFSSMARHLYNRGE